MEQTKITGSMAELDFEHGRIGIRVKGKDDCRPFLYITSAQLTELKEIFFEQISLPAKEIIIEFTLDNSILVSFEIKTEVSGNIRCCAGGLKPVCKKT